MSHKITEIDEVRLASIPELFDGHGWHQRGIPTEVFDTDTLKRILFVHDYAESGILIGKNFINTGQKYAVFEDRPIGKAVGKDWETPTNLELFELFKDALAGSDYKIVSCGTIDNRIEFFCDAKGDIQKAAKRDISPYVGIHRAFGGIGKILVRGHNIVMQCGNTTSLFIKEANGGENIETKNTKNVRNRLSWFQKQIETAHGVHGLFLKALNDAENEQISQTKAMEGFIGLTCNEKLTTRSANRCNRLLQLFLHGDGNHGKTLADWYSAVTDYYTHESAGSVDSSESRLEFLDKQFYSSEFGSSRARKTEITNSLFNKGEVHLEVFDDWRARGNDIVQSSSRDYVSKLEIIP